MPDTRPLRSTFKFRSTFIYCSPHVSTQVARSPVTMEALTPIVSGEHPASNHSELGLLRLAVALSTARCLIPLWASDPKTVIAAQACDCLSPPGGGGS
ncbi:hypothetical protein KC357_g84 [Hortaea werneckii]|nr:hypothetical protein KC357_g84 [Hortaea werneckii]